MQALTEPEFQGKLAVILAGYEEDIDGLLAVNAGMARRFPYKFVFPDLSSEALLQLLEDYLRREFSGLELAPEAVAALPMLSNRLKSLPKFSNGGTVQTLAKRAYAKRALRLQSYSGAAEQRVTVEDLNAAANDVMTALTDVATSGGSASLVDMASIKSIEDVFESHGLLGLEGIKDKLRTMAASIVIAIKEKKTPPEELNFLFVGNPGTGAVPYLRSAGSFISTPVLVQSAAPTRR